MKQALPQAATRRICRILNVSRSACYRPATPASTQADQGDDPQLLARLRELIQQHPTYGYRRLWARLRFGDKLVINRKKVHRIVQEQRWQVTQRQSTPRPRVAKRRSVAQHSNERWALDATNIDCGADGWGHLVAVIDCHDREIVGYEFALRGRAKEAERALEMACLARFGTLRPQGAVPVIRSDNGLIFQSRRFRDACRFYRLPQEFITPYTPEQNGMIERFFRSLKEECVWQHQFANFDEAQRAIRHWIRWYNEERPHQALGYRSPRHVAPAAHDHGRPSESVRAA